MSQTAQVIQGRSSKVETLDEIISAIETGLETNDMYFHSNEDNIVRRMGDALRATGFYEELNLFEIFKNCRCINESGLRQWLKNTNEHIKLLKYHRGE